MSIQTIFGSGKYNWINIDTDNTENLADFYEKYQIDNEVIAYSIDRNEQAILNMTKRQIRLWLCLMYRIKENLIIIMKQFRWFLL